jgi:hypothetical protein
VRGKDGKISKFMEFLHEVIWKATELAFVVQMTAYTSVREYEIARHDITLLLALSLAGKRSRPGGIGVPSRNNPHVDCQSMCP